MALRTKSPRLPISPGLSRCAARRPSRLPLLSRPPAPPSRRSPSSLRPSRAGLRPGGGAAASEGRPGADLPVLLLFGDVDQDAVGIGHLKLAEAAARKQLLPGFALGILLRAVIARRSILMRMLVVIGFEGRHAFNLETDVIERRPLDPGALEIGNLPWKNGQRDFAVGKVV